MRKKETAVDYMFIPEPDLPAVEISAEEVKQIELKLPEKPAAKVDRYVKEWKIDHVDAEVLSSEIMLAELFEKAAAAVNPILAAKWLRKELLRVLNYNKKELEEAKLDGKQIIQLLKLVEARKITDEIAKDVLEMLVEKPFDVEEYVKSNNLFAVGETDILEKYSKEAIAENPGAVADYKAGKEKALNFLVGSVMRKSKGKATAQQLAEIIKQLIK
jgi:aspartyl-tRNA(Asn)/glutamyl-tRNA(Gln) amidotransferase subunit B